MNNVEIAPIPIENSEQIIPKDVSAEDLQAL
jgi:hypothetical protein